MAGRALRVGLLVVILARAGGVASAQSLEERPDGFLRGAPATLLARAATNCLTPLAVETTARVREPRCSVLELVPIAGRESGWFLARYHRSAIVEWSEPADSVEWDEIVFLKASPGSDSVTPAWHMRTERTYEFLRDVTALRRAEGLLIEILICLNGTGGCMRDYLLDSGRGLQHVGMPFADELRARLVDGRTLHKGMTLDLETLRGVWPVARPGDANCCPSEAFDYVVRLDGDRLILTSAVLRAATLHD